MQVTILIPTALRLFTEGLSEVGVEGETVGEVLKELTLTYVDLQKHLFKDQDTLRSFVNVYLNEEDIRQKAGLATLLTEGDILMLIPSIAGGTESSELTQDEITRYSRHLILPEVGVEGQKKIKKSRVLLIGTGGLGAPLAMYLAAAGVGTLGIVN